MKEKSVQIGIMSGRLSKKTGDKIQAFPTQSWKNEFQKASSCGFNTIEWIFDLNQNPILTDHGIKDIKTLSEKFEVKIHSICCDYFMEKMLYGVPNNELEKNLDILKHLIHKCSKLGIKILEIPLVDSSSIKTVKDEDEFIFNIQKIIPLLESNDIFLTLETDFPPRKFEQFIGKFNHPNIKANYDIGNSASLGYNLKEELEIMNQWIINIHIKDRLFKGHSVPLGKGNVDFETFFLTLSKINFKGDLIIQGARLDDYEKPEVTCKKYLKFVNQYVDKYLR